MDVKFKYNEKLLVALIYANRDRFNAVTKKTALIIWSMCNKIIVRGVYVFRKTENYMLTKSFLTDQDIINDLYVNVFCELVINYEKEKGSFRYYLNKAVNYRVMRLVNLKARKDASVDLDDNCKASRDSRAVSILESNISHNEYDFLEFELKNFGFKDVEIKIVLDLVRLRYSDVKLSKKYNIDKFYILDLKEKLRKIYKDG